MARREPSRLDREASPEERALLVGCLFAATRARGPEARVLSLFPYLECFPLGAFNRHVAQRIEDLLMERDLPDGARAALVSHLRGLRDPFMPGIEALG